jgi:hypothetical protein
MNDREMLRHTVATLAYRAAKTMRGAPVTFADFTAGPPPGRRRARRAHGRPDGLGALDGGWPGKWNTATPQPWDQECARFFAAVKAFDDALAGNAPLGYELTRLFQGPVADASPTPASSP